jgi:hypothetical protein
MATSMQERRSRARRTTVSVVLAVSAGVVAVTHPAAGGASPAATGPGGSTPEVSTAANDPSSTTASTELPPVSSPASSVPAGSCVDDAGRTVGTLPGQDSCPDPLEPQPCQSTDPADCLSVPEVEGLAGAAGSNRPPGRGGASLRFTG